MRRTSVIFLATVTLFMAGSAQAVTVSARVGPLLKEAQNLEMAGNHKAAMAKLSEAEAARPTRNDELAIEQMRESFGVKYRGGKSPLGPASHD